MLLKKFQSILIPTICDRWQISINILLLLLLLLLPNINFVNRLNKFFGFRNPFIYKCVASVFLHILVLFFFGVFNTSREKNRLQKHFMHNKILLFEIYSHFACPTLILNILIQETHANYKDKIHTL